MLKPCNLDMTLEDKLDEFHFIELRGIEETIEDDIEVRIRFQLYVQLEGEFLEEMTEEVKIDLTTIMKYGTLNILEQQEKL